MQKLDDTLATIAPAIMYGTRIRLESLFLWFALRLWTCAWTHNSNSVLHDLV